jgi:hypothetical protein
LGKQHRGTERIKLQKIRKVGREDSRDKLEEKVRMSSKSQKKDGKEKGRE